MVRPFKISDRSVSLQVLGSWYVSTTSRFGQSPLGTSWYVLLTSQIGQSHLGTSWCVSVTSLFVQSLLSTSSYFFSRYLALRRYEVSKRSVSFRYQLGSLYDISSWSVHTSLKRLFSGPPSFRIRALGAGFSSYTQPPLQNLT